MKKLFFLLSALIGFNLTGQTTFTIVPNLDFATSATAVSGLDATGVTSAIDRVTGHVYQVGWVSVSGQKDLYVVEFDSTGVQVNVAQYDYSGNADKGLSICVTSSSVFVCGSSEATSGNADVIIIAYDLNLNQQWVQRIAGSAGTNDQGNSIATDGSSVFVGGYVTQTGKGKDYALFKLNISSGAILAQTKKNGNNLDDICEKIVVSGSNLYCTGSFHQATSNNDVLTMCVATASMTVTWSVTANGTATGGNDTGKDIKLDGSNIIICGSLNNSGTSDDYYFAVHTASTGAVTFSNTADAYGASDVANSLVCDKIGDYAITGNAMSGSLVVIWTQGFTASSFLWNNFQPTNGTFSTSAPKVNCDTIAKYFYTCYTYSNSVTGNLDAYLSQIDPTGVKKWQKLYDGGNGKDIHTDMVLDGYARIYLSTLAETSTTNVYQIKCLRYSQTPVYDPIDSLNEKPNPQFYFYPNQGQLTDTSGNPQPNILAETDLGYPKTYIRNNSISYVLSKIDTVLTTKDTIQQVDISFLGANSYAETTLFEQADNGYLNFYSDLHSPVENVNGYKRILIPNLYPNVDLQYYSNQNGMKYYFVVKYPIGGEYGAITFSITGHSSDTIISNKLVIKTVLGDITFDPPYSYQVDSTLNVRPKTSSWTKVAPGEYKVSITGSLSPFLPIVIELDHGNSTASTASINDVDWSTFVGGPTQDVYRNICVDQLGSTYANGNSYGGFPVLGPNAQPYSGQRDLVLTKYNKNGVRQWATNYGSAADNYIGWGGAVDANGLYYYMAANTNGNISYPLTQPTGAYVQTSYPSIPNEPFITKFDSLGKLIWATLLGCTSTESVLDFTLDNSGNLYLVGGSGITSAGTVPIVNKAGSYYKTTGGGFIIKFNTSHQIDWGTRIGTTGSPSGEALAIAVDGSNNVYVVGTIFDSLPKVKVPGGYNDTTVGGACDYYLLGFKASTDTLFWTTYIGGSGYESFYAHLTYKSRKLYMSGGTPSTDFPLLHKGHQYIDSSGGSFLMKFDLTTDTLDWSTYINEGIESIHTDYKDNLIMTGAASSGADTKQFIGSYWQPSPAGGIDATIKVFDSSDSLWYATYFGGQDDENFFSGVSFGQYTYFVGQSWSGQNASPIYPLSNLGGTPPAWWQNTISSPSSSNTDAVITRYNFANTLYAGIQEIGSAKSLFQNNVLLYPNPNTGSFALRFLNSISNPVKIEIFDILGQKIYERNLRECFKNQEELFNLDNAKSGMYFINLSSDKAKECIKLVKY